MTNVVLITADDMNWDAVGAFGCPTPGTTPTLDCLAEEGVRFNHAHVTIAVCQPSRSALMTGRYPHRCGGEGFYHLRFDGVPILPDLLRQAGYDVGILGKVPHSTPYADFQWDLKVDQPDLGMGRNPDVYGRLAQDFMVKAASGGRPFFLMANSHDPHRPFYGNDRPGWYAETDPPAVAPSRTFDPHDVVVPGFLADIPDVRLEIAEYYNSVRRCDDTVARILDALDASGTADDTLVMFLSDNGMAFPFAKTNCYLNSTRTPWIVRWPDVVAPGRADGKHFISAIDFLPTVLDAVGLDLPEGVDGSSFLPLLHGERQDGRDRVFTQFHQTHARDNFPMRCVQTRRYGYIFNPWSDGEREFRNESQSGRSWAAMREAARRDPDIAARTSFFSHRVLEEFYDFEADPDALHNRVDDPEVASEVDSLRDALANWMASVDDPAHDAFVNRASRHALDDLMDHLAGTLSVQET